MVIHISPELEAALIESARSRGTTPDALAIGALRERFLPPMPAVEPRDEWERALLRAATNCGVSLSDSALSRENLYE